MPQTGGLLHQSNGHLTRMEKILLAQAAADDVADEKEKSRERLKKRLSGS